MESWVYHQKGYAVPPPTRMGSGYSEKFTKEAGKEFQKDEKSGLLLPEGTVADRRKVQIGFHSSEEK